MVRRLDSAQCLANLPVRNLFINKNWKPTSGDLSQVCDSSEILADLPHFLVS